MACFKIVRWLRNACMLEMSVFYLGVSIAVVCYCILSDPVFPTRYTMRCNQLKVHVCTGQSTRRERMCTYR
jgi:hypothetical protein